ncbi:conserved hypothetical protein [delta proteobacterium NaphS2]|nr:conserved hypothetical protein [delta proteobacterium NaphS2]
MEKSFIKQGNFSDADACLIYGHHRTIFDVSINFRPYFM